jgi:hypothetical protein
VAARRGTAEYTPTGGRGFSHGSRDIADGMFTADAGLGVEFDHGFIESHAA